MGSQGKGHRELMGVWEGEGAVGRESHHGKGIVLWSRDHTMKNGLCLRDGTTPRGRDPRRDQ